MKTIPDTTPPKLVLNILVVVSVAIEIVSDSHPFIVISIYGMPNPYFDNIFICLKNQYGCEKRK